MHWPPLRRRQHSVSPSSGSSQYSVQCAVPLGAKLWLLQTGRNITNLVVPGFLLGSGALGSVKTAPSYTPSCERGARAPLSLCAVCCQVWRVTGGGRWGARLMPLAISAPAAMLLRVAVSAILGCARPTMNYDGRCRAASGKV